MSICLCYIYHKLSKWLGLSNSKSKLRIKESIGNKISDFHKQKLIYKLISQKYILKKSWKLSEIIGLKNVMFHGNIGYRLWNFLVYSDSSKFHDEKITFWGNKNYWIRIWNLKYFTLLIFFIFINFISDCINVLYK